MKTRSLAALVVSCALLLGARNASAQENWTEGPVWACSAYRSEPGQYQAYMKYLRANALPTYTEEKKQGLILDWKVFLKAPHEPNDWDVMACSLHPNYGQALDYSKADDEKLKAIRAKLLKTSDEPKQEELLKVRLAMRRFLGTEYMREVNLRPMP